jgi:hypothetical protein
MKVNEVYIIKYLKEVYGGTISGAGDCIYVEVNGDKFRVNLTDKKRFGYYTFFHRNSGCDLDGKYYYHTQLKDKCLAHGLFLIWCHKFNKEIGIWSTHEDWIRFVNDAYRYAIKRENEYATVEELCRGQLESVKSVDIIF